MEILMVFCLVSLYFLMFVLWDFERIIVYGDLFGNVCVLLLYGELILGRIDVVLFLG